MIPITRLIYYVIFSSLEGGHYAEIKRAHLTRDRAVKFVASHPTTKLDFPAVEKSAMEEGRFEWSYTPQISFVVEVETV